jgi:uncharacterized protein (TIGR03435 family)
MRNKTFRNTLLLATVGVFAFSASNAMRLRAQVPAYQSPTFEVASVKQNKSGAPFTQMGGPPGRFIATNMPLRQLIIFAYQVHEFQIAGGPAWITTDRFDIAAKGEGPAPPRMPNGPPGPLQLMMQALLADRFKLVTHHETREQTIYALVLARTDSKLGRQLKQSATDCAALIAARGRSSSPPPPPPPGVRPECGMSMRPGSLQGGGFPLSQLAQPLSQIVQRIVLDRTGLTGNFDFELTWTPDQLQDFKGSSDLPPGTLPQINGFPFDPNGPSIFTAVQEQLGLKLESTKGPVDVLVIDHVEQPTPD